VSGRYYFSDVPFTDEGSGTSSDDHPHADIRAGDHFLAEVYHALAAGKWANTVLIVNYDEWGGFYDHVVPPKIDGEGYGIRVPGLMISAYAKKGYIDHQVYSFDVYLKFIEDLFLGGQRLDPYTDGRWDPRPDVREDERALGDLMREFDFDRPPREPLILPQYP